MPSYHLNAMAMHQQLGSAIPMPPLKIKHLPIPTIAVLIICLFPNS